ncbi:hypothetical protein B2G71_01240 [Novosphingobium sp. PC22D]|uniref:putative quinol monooxygenase n=1 Tax=Novosphingobium sp. PC22D TaxID=1962403 RepID=UPI000BEFE13C|nr:putative quinol monooxygenase [Novosphingobium sp. PC22D]PEQ14260.1 hypothetical protein B2G71_01240 [Novosphingobium sp. PC22D]
MAQLANIVLLRARPGRIDDLEAALRTLLAATHQEAGCAGGELHRSAEDEALFMVYERWTDQAGFDAHMAEPHVAQFLAAADDLLAEPAEVRAFETLT